MKTQGTLEHITLDYLSRRTIVSFAVDAKPAEIEGYRDMQLDVSFDKHREKRSQDANAYFHVLVGKIAEKLNTSNAEVKNRLIADYGEVNFLPDGSLDWSVKPEAFDWTRSLETHYQPTDRYIMDKGKKCIVYIVMRGSRTYNTKEMSRLIDGAVNEAKELGIETMTPNQIAEMMSKWRPKTDEVH